ncbi:LysR family transcriptional regulator [Oceanicola sp. S124]|uniref:LysR family transcriptional regulator n=1 Tax=Oceanicola sp. S124 TaxID=1042378 RepID=UPI00025581C8|nr:LysR family transcriptional regulator [Oceanicola sp. S124]
MTRSMPITIRQLEVLNGIASAGSIRRAAKLLGLSQPTISAQLAKLEGALGTELVNRSHGRPGALTAAGELWARTAHCVLDELDEGHNRHSELFGQQRYKMSFATIPSHAGRVLGLAAALAEADPAFSEFTVSLAPSSAALLEYIAIRKARVGLLAMTEVLRQTSSLVSEKIYEDRIFWAVPRSVDPDMVREILYRASGGAELPQPLRRRVVVHAPHEWSTTSDTWYQSVLPAAAPFYMSDLHVGAVEIVAAGLATCHVSMTLKCNLPERIRDHVAFYDTGLNAQTMVLAIPRHLMAVPTFSGYFRGLATALRDHYARTLPASAFCPGRSGALMPGL